MARGKQKIESQKKAQAKAADKKLGGGGAQGKAQRTAKFNVVCPVCKINMNDMVALKIHHDAKHPKVAFVEPEGV